MILGGPRQFFSSQFAFLYFGGFCQMFGLWTHGNGRYGHWTVLHFPSFFLVFDFSQIFSNVEPYF